MKRKELRALIVGILLVFTLTACGSGQAETSRQGGLATGTPQPPEESNAGISPHPDKLVVYFSATGATKGVAEKVAALAGADLREIVPSQPYTPEDLNHRDQTARTFLEQNDPDARPEITEDIPIDGYSTIYLGYPIWFGQAPRILSAFVESHPFDKVTVIPFCTSGSSGIGQSDNILAEQAGSGRWLPGRRFPGNVTESELQAWIDETEEMNRMNSMRMYINEAEVSVAWENNDSVDALADLAASGPIAIQMSMYGGFEQVGPLGATLPRSDSPTTTSAGDIVLYSGNQIVVFYGSNSWSYTRLGRITDQSEAELTALLGEGDVLLTISVGAPAE